MTVLSRLPACLAALLALPLVVAALAEPAAAQTRTDSLVTCESIDRQATRCGPANASNPRLVRQLSRRSCRRGRTWGFDGAGLWVTGGCRAQFLLNVPVSGDTAGNTGNGQAGGGGNIKLGDQAGSGGDNGVRTGSGAVK